MGTIVETGVVHNPGETVHARHVVRVAVIGATGYAGRELIVLLARHPAARIVRLMSSGRSGTQPFPVKQAHPALRGPAAWPVGSVCHPLSSDDLDPSDVDLVFLATPHETSHEVAPALVDRGLRVIDLSGAFRLKDPGARARWYQFEHHALEALDRAVYGLPEINACEIQCAQLVANPGCYATSIILALAPLVKAGWADLEAGLICDAKSGASGAGRAPSDRLHFVEVNENCRAYSLFTHRHLPEIAQALGLEQGQLTFTPHLLPINRGILSTIYVRLDVPRTPHDVLSLYQDFYSAAPLVRVYSDGTLPEIQAVAHTNYADIGFVIDPNPQSKRLVLVSALDNLGKGAAGQAVQNMNLMFGFAEEAALV